MNYFLPTAWCDQKHLVVFLFLFCASHFTMLNVNLSSNGLWTWKWRCFLMEQHFHTTGTIRDFLGRLNHCWQQIFASTPAYSALVEKAPVRLNFPGPARLIKPCDPSLRSYFWPAWGSTMINEDCSSPPSPRSQNKNWSLGLSYAALSFLAFPAKAEP